MLEVTKEMLDNIIETQKEKKIKSDKYTQIVAKIALIAAAVEFIVFCMFISINLLKAFAFLVIAVIADIVFLFAATLLLSFKYIDGFTVGAFFHALKCQKYNSELLAADEKGKERLYENRYANAKGGEKLLASNGVIGICLRMNDFDRAEKIINEVAGIEPKNFLQRAVRASNYIALYEARNDEENYIKTYRESEKLIAEMWDNTLDTKLEALRWTASYLAYSGQYEKAIEYYNYLIDFQNKAAETDANLAVTDEHLNAGNIDLAEIYCKLGNTEKAAECFRAASEFFAETEVPICKSELERVGKILDEAGIEYSCHDSNCTEE